MREKEHLATETIAISCLYIYFLIIKKSIIKKQACVQDIDVHGITFNILSHGSIWSNYSIKTTLDWVKLWRNDKKQLSNPT